MKSIPVDFGEVRQTINIPIAIARHMDRTDILTAVAVRCIDQQEYSLLKRLFMYIV